MRFSALLRRAPFRLITFQRDIGDCQTDHTHISGGQLAYIKRLLWFPIADPTDIES
jgi:hypothetical protein